MRKPILIAVSLSFVVGFVCAIITSLFVYIIYLIHFSLSRGRSKKSIQNDEASGDADSGQG